MLNTNTRIKSNFLNKEGKHIFGTVMSSQEGGGAFARGYFILFDHCPSTQLFLNEKALYELYEILSEPVDETVYNIDDKGQLSFI